jgi:hypothetical protein
MSASNRTNWTAFLVAVVALLVLALAFFGGIIGGCKLIAYYTREVFT